MVSPVWFLPSVVVVLAAAAWLLPRVSDRADRLVRRISQQLFRRFVSVTPERERTVEAAYIAETARAYAARTLLYTVLGFVGGAVAGAYLTAGALAVFEGFVRTLTGLPDTIAVPLGARVDYRLVLTNAEWWAIVLGGGVVTGILTGVLAYVFRWELPESDAEVRRRSIEEGLPRTTAFMFALARGGVEFPTILRGLAANREIYGETAEEMSVVVREMDLFGRDMITALRRMARRTPSDQLKTFTENLASVLQSGRSLPAFLDEQYERFREEAEARQDEILELLGTMATGYVIVLVAGVLFLITILLVFGLTTTDTLVFLQAIAYLLVPLGNAGFAIFLGQQLQSLGMGGLRSAGTLADRAVETPTQGSPRVDSRRADGGLAGERETRVTLAWYDRFSRLKAAIRSPLRRMIRNPTTVLYVTVPVAVLAVAVRLPGALLGTGVNLRVLDDILVQSVLLVLLPYAVVRQLYRRRIEGIEAATPELLERLASLNEAGMSLVQGFNRIRGGDLGTLTPEVERIWRDIEYGSNLEDALVRFGRRVRTTAITRAVTLLTRGMRASGDIGKVLRIAADQSRAELRLRRSRRQQMFTYLVVIYITFLVFLVIIVAVNEVLVPSLPESVPQPRSDRISRLGVNADQFARLGQVDKAAYTLVFFHTALVQAVCSGFIAGQLGEGTLRDGAKHAAAMLALGYVVFLVISSPVASIAAGNAVSTGDAIEIESASLSDGGYVAVYDGGVNGTILGQSGYIEAGTHENVVVPLDRAIRENRTVVMVTHMDTDGNGAFDYAGPPYVPNGTMTDRPYPTLSGEAPGVEVQVGYAGP